jgi:hypothetical protein
MAASTHILLISFSVIEPHYSPEWDERKRILLTTPCVFAAFAPWR